MKKEETNDIVQYLIPSLKKLQIPLENCKVDVTTEKSGRKRGDIWISLIAQSHKDFEKHIIALIEAKHRNSTIGDMDWRDAMLCVSEFRFYNAFNDEEIRLDGKVLVSVVTIDVLQKIQSQISLDNSYVIHKASQTTRPFSETKFRSTLKKLADIYRSAGLKKGDERIDPTISFVVLKYISEQQKEKRTLPKAIKLWDQLMEIAIDEGEGGDLRSEFRNMESLIWGEDSEYKENIYKDFRNLINFPSRLKNEHFKKIYKELNGYHFHGANFDLFGSIYEEFASQTKKKEFGEFYTRRHITGMVARLLLRNEKNPRDFKVCDPACGTGGFLTEAYQTLVNNYSLNKKLDEKVEERLKENIFWGYDNDEVSVARTKLNMFLVGDGHVNIYENDSLVDKNKKGWKEDEFDYIMTNPSMGKYDGEAEINDFDFTNERRYELIFLEKALKALKPGGEIAIVINDGALEAPTREKFRRKLLEWCHIYAIVSLTKYAFAPYTKEKTYILFMQKKQEEHVGNIQEFPIWHFILDYDGYANSDKRYRTKYHDDLPKLEEKFPGAIELLNIYSNNQDKFNQEKINFESQVNAREKEEGLWGMKYGYVKIEKINTENFYNLLSEFHLRPVEINRIQEKEFDNLIYGVIEKLPLIEKNIKELKSLI